MSSSPKNEPTPPPAKRAHTRVTVTHDCGFGNFITIRGQGDGLNWEKGIPLKNVKCDEWIWETTDPFHTIEFKVLINDQCYETGENHTLAPGATLKYDPSF